MMKKNAKPDSGFVILFAVTLAALLLSIALGVGTIAEKEVRFRTSAAATNLTIVRLTDNCQFYGTWKRRPKRVRARHT